MAKLNIFNLDEFSKKMFWILTGTSKKMDEFSRNRSKSPCKPNFRKISCIMSDVDSCKNDLFYKILWSFINSGEIEHFHFGLVFQNWSGSLPDFSKQKLDEFSRNRSESPWKPNFRENSKVMLILVKMINSTKFYGSKLC